jgi:hypothetical protein
MFTLQNKGNYCGLHTCAVTQQTKGGIGQHFLKSARALTSESFCHFSEYKLQHVEDFSKAQGDHSDNE